MQNTENSRVRLYFCFYLFNGFKVILVFSAGIDGILGTKTNLEIVDIFSFPPNVPFPEEDKVKCLIDLLSFRLFLNAVRNRFQIRKLNIKSKPVGTILIIS